MNAPAQPKSKLKRREHRAPVFTILCFTFAFLGVSICSPSAICCDIPVFRYALDRWTADTFKLEAPAELLRKEPLAREFRNLTDHSGLNLEVTVQTDRLKAELQTFGVPPSGGIASGSNLCRLFFPSHVRSATTPAWTGELTDKIYKSLTDSSARQELAKRILAGDSAVWVMVECGEPEKDERLAKLFNERLRFLQSAIGLPPIDPSDPDSKLGPGPELQVKLSLLRVKRDDINENTFLSMLAGPKGLSAFSENEPFVAVVFGRGRVLGAWPYKNVSEEFIEEATRFLIGSCSCEVKNQNPGWDLLMRVDWEAELKKVDQKRRETTGEGREQENPQTTLTPETVTFTPKEGRARHSVRAEAQSPKDGAQRTDAPYQKKWLFLGAGTLAIAALFLRKLW